MLVRLSWELVVDGGTCGSADSWPVSAVVIASQGSGNVLAVVAYDIEMASRRTRRT